jgi:hypothetical protein
MSNSNLLLDLTSLIQNGALTALPFIASWSIKNCCARFSDWLQRRCGYSTTAVRKTFATIGKNKCDISPLHNVIIQVRLF